MSIKRQQIKILVARLVSGAARAEDVKDILVYLRDNYQDQLILKEVGHFIAHTGKRDRGLATEHVQNVFDCLAVDAPAIGDQLTDQAMLDARKRMIKYRLEHMSEIEAAAASTTLDYVKERGRELCDALVSVRPRFNFETKPEALDDRILKLLNPAPLSAAFKDITLAEQLARACLLNKLADVQEAAALSDENCRSLVTRVVVSMIHGCELKLKGWPLATIVAGIDGDHLDVKASFRIEYRKQPMDIRFPLFSTSETALSSCHSSLLNLDVWDVPIHVSNDGMLTVLSE